ncbi:hypothetical protein AURDEDRAFT_176268 [Auricularia subglabra TFB-10046 SS5]|uniref:Uncharacterized protein n=1 Tax=Auricularia subglabra (strain TFB-10046 / SS5) TaxID=717982 RepID=J0CW20_AURST|nr:hypothetical protein AURDEDRAFT_176268 [Auricularia subglabra TFB-10046 SS5]
MCRQADVACPNGLTKATAAVRILKKAQEVVGSICDEACADAHASLVAVLGSLAGYVLRDAAEEKLTLNTWEIRIRAAQGGGCYVIMDAEVLTNGSLARAYIAAPQFDDYARRAFSFARRKIVLAHMDERTAELDVVLACFRNNKRYQNIQIPRMRDFRSQELFLVTAVPMSR